MIAEAKTTPSDTQRHPKKKAFLAAFAQQGNVKGACEAAGIARCTHYAWLESDPDYKRAFNDAKEDAADALEAEARRRAFAGSDLLLIFLLKGLRPEKYRDRYDPRTSSNEQEIVLQPIKFLGRE
jgi:hypothetical protein